jgi:PAS domain S-box-containing protein
MSELSDRRLFGLFEAAPDAMLCVTAEGRIALANAQAARLFGYRREELADQPVEMLVPEALRAVHIRHRAEYLKDPHPRPMGTGMKLAGRRRDGSTFPAEVFLSAMDTDDEILVMAAVRDLTGRMEAQAERAQLISQAARDKGQARSQQAQRLENLGQLAGGIAHDFNNLIAVILNYASFISEELAGVPEPDWVQHRDAARSDLDQITLAGERAASLTRQLLAFSRREVTRPRVVDIGTVVTGIEEMLRRTIGEHVELVTSLADDLWPVLADPGQLEQLLVNLAVNGRDAMPDGGVLTIDTSNVTVDTDSIAGGSTSRQGKNVRLRVSDTGTGMSSEVVEHAFEPFFTTKEEGTGTGLGLATAYGMVTQAEGQIHIYSEIGVGTTFSITLPVTTESPAPLVEAVPYQRTPKGEAVLVVEDATALREVTRRILARAGYHVITAANGPEALEIARSHPGEIHLLVTDVVMPHMLGKDVAQKMQQIKPGIAVLYMSGYARSVLSVQGRLEPNMVLVEKPFSAADLLAKAGEVLNGKFPGFGNRRIASD